MHTPKVKSAKKHSQFRFHHEHHRVGSSVIRAWVDERGMRWIQVADVDRLCDKGLTTILSRTNSPMVEKLYRPRRTRKGKRMPGRGLTWHATAEAINRALSREDYLCPEVYSFIRKMAREDSEARQRRANEIQRAAEAQQREAQKQEAHREALDKPQSGESNGPIQDLVEKTRDLHESVKALQGLKIDAKKVAALAADDLREDVKKEIAESDWLRGVVNEMVHDELRKREDLIRTIDREVEQGTTLFQIIQAAWKANPPRSGEDLSVFFEKKEVSA